MLRNKGLIFSLILPVIILPTMLLLISQVLIANGVDNEIISQTAVESNANASGSILEIIFPIVITSLLTSGGTNIATDVFAGERERGVLERLLITQAEPSDIFWGKIFVIQTFSLFEAIIALLTFAFSETLLSYVNFNTVQADVQLELNGGKVALLAICVVGYTFFVSSLYGVISVFSHSVKSAYGMMGIVSFFPVLFGILSGLISLDEKYWYVLLIPIYNFILSLRMIFLNTYNICDFLLFACSTLGFEVTFITISKLRLNGENSM